MKRGERTKDEERRETEVMKTGVRPKNEERREP